MIRTWAVNVKGLLKKEKYLLYYEKLPLERRRKADALLYQSDKAQSVGAGVLFQMMSEAYGLSENAVYNLSHSGEYALCSVEDEESDAVHVGCDIEQVKELKLRLAKRFFCEREYQFIVNQDTQEKQIDAFYRYWVLKESFMKATRQGMKLGMNQFEIDLSDGNAPYLIRQPEQFGERYYFKEYELKEAGYKIAVCADSAQIADMIQVVEL